ncbi:HIT family protein [Candidatus Micrarchaeota archaeon]|nr:HIT family protein [Candidatus Micrarchaeota archaeon]
MADCLFCKVASGEVPSSKVYEDSLFMAFLDLYPANKGHVLISPKKHSESVWNLSEEELAGMALLAQRIAKALKDALQCDGVNILQNNGESAGQLIFHNHLHVIPRFKGDDLELKWPRNLYKEGEMDSYRNKIKEKL